jgi:predicted enzyme related to lactoylglutathione lyase
MPCYGNFHEIKVEEERLMQQTAIRVREIAFTGYPVKDLPRARTFYESVLHLKPSKVSDDGTWVEYDVNGAAFFIGNFEDWPPAKGGPAIAFEVDDLDQTMHILRDAKVQIFAEPFETPVCRIAIIGDPDNNSIMMHQHK